MFLFCEFISFSHNVLIIFWSYATNTCASSFHKHLIKGKNNDNNFSIKTEAIVRNVVNLRIKEALLIASLQPQINSRLELNSEYIIN